MIPNWSCNGERLAPVPGVDVCGNNRAERSNEDLSPYSRRGMPRVRTSSAVTAAGSVAIANDPAPTKERLVSRDVGLDDFISFSVPQAQMDR